MNKLNQFSGRGAYVQPYCKSVQIQTRQTILAGSLTGGSDSLEGMNSRDTSGWGWDDED